MQALDAEDYASYLKEQEESMVGTESFLSVSQTIHGKLFEFSAGFAFVCVNSFSLLLLRYICKRCETHASKVCTCRYWFGTILTMKNLTR